MPQLTLRNAYLLLLPLLRVAVVVVAQAAKKSESLLNLVSRLTLSFLRENSFL
jgi:hypothetical protein